MVADPLRLESLHEVPARCGSQGCGYGHKNELSLQRWSHRVVLTFAEQREAVCSLDHILLVMIFYFL